MHAAYRIVDALAAPPPALTRRDVWLPAVPGKAVAGIGMRRACKTTFLWQVLADRLSKGTEVDFLARYPAGQEELIQGSEGRPW